MEQKKEDILIEIIQHQVPCSKEVARYFLKKNNYHLISTIKDVEENNHYVLEETITVSGNKLKETIKRLMKEANVIHLSIVKDGKVLISIPATVTMIMVYLYPLLTTLTFVYFLKHQFSIRILKTS